jgi:hypothetical protein
VQQQVEHIDRCPQYSSKQHAQFFDDMRLGHDGNQTEREGRCKEKVEGCLVDEVQARGSRGVGRHMTWNSTKKKTANLMIQEIGAVDGARTRDPRRDRPVL